MRSDVRSWTRGGVLAGAVVALAALGSCSLLYDVDALRATGQEAPDAGRLDASPPPGSLVIYGIEPSMLAEGEGAVMPVPVVLTGANFAPDATVTLDGAHFDNTPVEAEISSEGDRMVIRVSLEALPNLPEGMATAISVRVEQDDEAASKSLSVQGLEEFIASRDAPDGTLSVTEIAERYSSIDIDQDLRLVGETPAVFFATAKVTIAAHLSADGASPEESEAGAAGPGGCDGGSATLTPACGPNATSGGQAGGANGGGGGGGGHAVKGTPGAGSDGGDGGEAAGNAFLIPLAGDGGNGGGGSGNAAGGGGGGGGGVLAVTTDGDFTIEANGLLSANGGQGGPGICNESTSIGSGGGGSGGSILVRVRGTVLDQGAAERLTVQNGRGGEIGPDTDCDTRGGSGAVGRVRVDLPTEGTLPSFVPRSPGPAQGPIIRSDTPVVSRESELLVHVAGGPNTKYLLGVRGQQGKTVMTDAERSVTQAVTLSEGRNEVCVAIPDVSPVNEGEHCVFIAYLP